MTDAEYETQKARVLALIDRWGSGPLWLHRWKLTHDFHRDYLVDLCGNPDHDTAARAGTNWEYMDARIDWNVPQIAQSDDEELEFIVIHEIMHVYLAEMQPKPGPASKHEERVATQLACAFRETWAAGAQAGFDPMVWNG